MLFRAQTGIPGDHQESSFMNATLQRVEGTPIEFSIAVHVNINAEELTEDDVVDILRKTFEPLSGNSAVEIEVQVGPEGSGPQ